MALKERVEEAKRIALQEIKVNENQIQRFPDMAKLKHRVYQFIF